MFKLFHGIGGVLDGVPNDDGMIKDFKVISAFSRFITEEVNFTEIVRFQVTQAEGLVPALRECINRNLTTDGVLKSVIGKFGFKGFNQFIANIVGFIESFECQTFFISAITTDWRDVNHGITEFNETASFNWNIQIGNVTEDEIY